LYKGMETEKQFLNSSAYKTCLEQDQKVKNQEKNTKNNHLESSAKS